MTSGVNEIVIVKATRLDIDAIKQIADAHRRELGFIRRPSLLEAIDRSEVFLAKKSDIPIGFVEYRHRKDEQTTLYNIAVMSEYRNSGVGRKLVERLKAESQERKKTYILLKCPEDLPANKFYSIIGFHLYETEPGKHRKLNIWRWTF